MSHNINTISLFKLCRHYLLVLTFLFCTYVLTLYICVYIQLGFIPSVVLKFSNNILVPLGCRKIVFEYWKIHVEGCQYIWITICSFGWPLMFENHQYTQGSVSMSRGFLVSSESCQYNQKAFSMSGGNQYIVGPSVHSKGCSYVWESFFFTTLTIRKLLRIAPAVGNPYHLILLLFLCYSSNVVTFKCISSYYYYHSKAADNCVCCPITPYYNCYQCLHFSWDTWHPRFAGQAATTISHANRHHKVCFWLSYCVIVTPSISNQSSWPVITKVYVNYALGSPQVSFCVQSWNLPPIIHVGCCYSVCSLLSGSNVVTFKTMGAQPFGFTPLQPFRQHPLQVYVLLILVCSPYRSSLRTCSFHCFALGFP